MSVGAPAALVGPPPPYRQPPVLREGDAHFAGALERIVRDVTALATSEAGWRHCGVHDGVTCWVGTSAGPAAAARGDAVLAFPPRVVLDLIVAYERQRELDRTALESIALVRSVNEQAGIDHLRFRGVWPVAARDVCALWRWVVLPDGSCVCGAVSVDEPSVPPDPTGAVVRARLDVGGWLLRPVDDGRGCTITYVVVTDPRGHIPRRLVQWVSRRRARARAARGGQHCLRLWCA